MERPTSQDMQTPSASQPIDQAWLARWLQAFQQEQFKQSKYLSNISTIATIIGLLILLSVVFGACSALGLFWPKRPPNTSLELTMAAGGSGARHSGRWMLRAGSSARSRWAAARNHES
jgi:hypothetical protein